MTDDDDDDSPIHVGDTGAPFVPVFKYKNGNPVPLTGATITMKMVGANTDLIKNCTGTWTIDDAANGRAHYQYQASDLDTPDVWMRYITITVGGKPLHADEKALVVEYAP